jgi:hypothetical protein
VSNDYNKHHVIVFWERTFPDVQTHGQFWRPKKQADGDEEHVRHDVLQPQGDKGENRPPHANHLGSQVLSL